MISSIYLSVKDFSDMRVGVYTLLNSVYKRCLSFDVLLGIHLSVNDFIYLFISQRFYLFIYQSKILSIHLSVNDFSDMRVGVYTLLNAVYKRC